MSAFLTQKRLVRIGMIYAGKIAAQRAFRDKVQLRTFGPVKLRYLSFLIPNKKKRILRRKCNSLCPIFVLSAVVQAALDDFNNITNYQDNRALLFMSMTIWLLFSLL